MRQSNTSNNNTAEGRQAVMEGGANVVAAWTTCAHVTTVPYCIKTVVSGTGSTTMVAVYSW